MSERDGRQHDTWKISFVGWGCLGTHSKKILPLRQVFVIRSRCERPIPPWKAVGRGPLKQPKSLGRWSEDMDEWFGLAWPPLGRRVTNRVSLKNLEKECAKRTKSYKGINECTLVSANHDSSSLSHPLWSPGSNSFPLLSSSSVLQNLFCKKTMYDVIK